MSGPTSSSSSSAVPDLGTFSIANGVELPQIRPLDDFLVDKARYEAPPFNDLARWNNRIISNLLYYQTNYITFFVALFVISSFFNARDLVLGLTAVVVGGVVGYGTLSPNSMFVNTRRDHPLVCFGAVAVTLYYVFYMFSSVMVLLFSLLLPLFFVLIHASTRLRNFRAKFNQQAERLGLKQTVMGRILDAIGCDVKA
ncbi:praf-3 [Pristionchus pacificus]|uniref:PRA1 family protein n=1 Tax=Pristionchus pacificus TaxID=54126 RepID=A0A454Y4P9_PRIPA|nr:praf-3 [Pristionchus pacificus]|eukprot:PDM75641.1 praf-3 [Pristionchus pacificus]